MEAQAFRGLWWLPGRQDRAVTGTLQFSREEGGSLEILGALTDIDSTFGFFNPEVILGRTTSGKAITIYRCLQTGGELASGGIPTSSFHGSVVLVGAHINDPKALLLSEMSVSYDRLAQWARLPAFSRTVSPDTGPGFQCSVNYEWPPAHQVDFKGTRVRFIPQVSMEGDGLSRVALVQELAIEVKPPEPRSLEDYLDGIFYHLRNFLTLGIGKPTFPTSIKAKFQLTLSDRPEESQDSQEIEILIRVRGPRSEEAILPIFMLFAFGDISADYERVLSNWLEKAPKLGPICDLYFGTFYNPTMYLQSQFLALVQAVEAFHRRSDDRGYLAESDFRVLLKDLQSVVTNRQPQPDEETTCALMSRLSHANEYTLKRRLEEVIRGLGALPEIVIGDQKRFIKLAADTRNYLTHYDKDLERKCASIEEMHHLVMCLQFILEMHFLKEIGLSDESVARLAGRNQKYQQMRQFA